jgi:hypothetical protein
MEDPLPRWAASCKEISSWLLIPVVFRMYLQVDGMGRPFSRYQTKDQAIEK